MSEEFSQGSPQWLAFRRTRVGGSDAACVMSENPWKTPYELWQEKVGLKPPQEENYAMREGKRLEPIALEHYEKITGESMIPQVFLHPQNNRIMASVDGASIDGLKAIEIKCSEKIYRKACCAVIDPIYQWQLQHIMMCLDISHIDFAAYWEGEIVIMQVYRNQEMIDRLYPKLVEFLEMIKTKNYTWEIPQDEYIKKTDDYFLELETNYLHNMDLADFHKERAEIIRNEMILLAGNQNCKGNKIKMTRFEKRGNVDYSKIEVLRDIDLDQYRKPPSIQWRITHDEPNFKSDTND